MAGIKSLINNPHMKTNQEFSLVNLLNPPVFLRLFTKINFSGVCIKLWLLE
jgi:hypothetical protein